MNDIKKTITVIMKIYKCKFVIRILLWITYVRYNTGTSSKCHFFEF